MLELVNTNERLLKEKKEIELKEMIEQKDILLVMREQQLVKILSLEKQFEEVKEHPGVNNIKTTPAFYDTLASTEATFTFPSCLCQHPSID
jgi:hypothetical protein